jgi:CDP-4-dehydro-6-deoxyglucose reductase, E3
VRVRLFKSNISFSVARDQSVLDAGLGASLNLPHSCKGGNCGSCRARLLEGEIYYPNGPPLALSDGEVADGFVLLCQARARSDLVIEIREITTPDQAVIKRLPARVERAVPLSHDVMGLYLRLPAAEDFHFDAGQYIDIMLPGGRRRSFSMASPPHDSRLLELHVRRVAGGEFSAPLFDGNAQSALLTIEGPLGHFVYRPATPRAAVPDVAAPGVAPNAAVPSIVGQGIAPMLLVGGGTGLAPLLSIIRHVAEKGIERDMTLYWGVRSERDLYAHATLEELSRRLAALAVGSDLQPPSLPGAGLSPVGATVGLPARLRYVPVLSGPSPEWRGAHGFVHEAVMRDIQDLERYDVYAAGPPAMIAAVRDEFGRRGVAANRLFFDSFDYAPDSIPRQRTSAATKS